MFEKSSVGEDVEHSEFSYAPGGNVYWYNHFEMMEESTKAEYVCTDTYPTFVCWKFKPSLLHNVTVFVDMILRRSLR